MSVFELRDFNRYKNFIINKDFDRLQVYVYWKDANVSHSGKSENFDGFSSVNSRFAYSTYFDIESLKKKIYVKQVVGKSKIDDFGGNTDEVLKLLDAYVHFDEKWFDELKSDIENKEVDDEMIDFIHRGQQLMAKYLLNKMSVTEMMQFIPIDIRIGVKRKWYHYLFL